MLFEANAHQRPGRVPPFGLQGNVMYYDKKVLKAAGLDPDKPPQTWDEMDAACKKVKAIGKTCLALGMTSREIDDRIDEIVEFTELGEAIHRPLRTYSSGMRARLHFAIATSVRPRILLIDEALAVGDRAFRAKSAERIDELLAEAGTLMLVSHSLDEIRKQCNRAIWIEEGIVKADGPVEDVLDEYGAG